MDATLDFLTKHKEGEKPMFTVTWFPSPHGPHPEIPESIDNASTLYSKEAGKLAGYYREITLLDEQIGKLRKHLRDLGIEKNTLFWYCSDNGGLDPKSSGGRAKKGSIYEGGLRIPSVIEWPAKYGAKQIDTPAFTCDMYPTLLNIAGAKVANQPLLDGIDIAGIIAGKQTEHPGMGFWHNHTSGQGTHSDRIIKALMEAQQKGAENPFPERLLKNVREFPTFKKGEFKGHAAWNKWPWKLHRIQNGEKVVYELYHLESDPMESNDLVDAPENKERVIQMKTALESWQVSVLNSWSGKDY